MIELFPVEELYDEARSDKRVVKAVDAGHKVYPMDAHNFSAPDFMNKEVEQIKMPLVHKKRQEDKQADNKTQNMQGRRYHDADMPVRKRQETARRSAKRVQSSRSCGSSSNLQTASDLQELKWFFGMVAFGCMFFGMMIGARLFMQGNFNNILHRAGSNIVSVVSAQDKLPATMEYVQPDDRDNYKIITIKNGDSLWSIANTYRSEACQSVNDMIDRIIICNDLKNSKIYAGQTLRIPVYESCDDNSGI